LRTLVVDDNRIFRKVMSLMLAGYSDCAFAEDGKEGVRAFEDGLRTGAPFDLICMDLTMPEFNGLEALKAIRKTERDWKVPERKMAKVLMVTASLERCHVMEAANSRCDGYLVKPLKKETLLSKLRELSFPLERQEPPPPPVAATASGGPAELKLLVPPSDAIWGATEKPAGNINYFKLFKELKPVRPGQILAEVPDWRPGETAAPRLGEGVFFDQANKVVVARRAGRVELRGDALGVNDSVVIHGNVDLRCGNVEFPGYVIVNGDVFDNFTVNGKSGITVAGNVGAATLESDGDIEADSVHARERGSIKCGGAFRARLVYDALVESQGDIVVGQEALNCGLRARGRISCADGSISGGSCMGLKGVEAGVLGGEGELATVVCSGADYVVLDQLEELRERLAKSQKASEDIRGMLGALADVADLDTVTSLAPARRAQVEELRQKLTDAKAESAELRERLELIQYDFSEGAVHRVDLLRKLWPGVRLEIGHVTETFHREILGPVGIVENPEAMSLTFLPLSGPG